MYHRVKTYNSYAVFGDGSVITRSHEFNHEDAEEIGGVLEDDGIDVVLAQKLIQIWNERLSICDNLVVSKLEYSINLV